MKSLLLFLITIFTATCAYAQPTTNFSATPLEICVGESIQFTDLSTSTQTITSWTWDFGDGSTSALQSPSHTYTNSGTFTVILTAVDANGATPEVKINLITVNPLPNPSFDPTIIGGCTLPNSVSLTNIQPNSGVTYSWDFGNGTTSTSGTPANVTYTTENTFDITLTVTDNLTGCVNSVVETVSIFNYQTDFSFSPTPGCVGRPISFLDGSSPGADSWTWDFGDGSSSTDQNPFHVYTAIGSYTVTLTASNSLNGCTDTKTVVIEVFALPTPSFTYNAGSGCAPLDVDFTNTSNGSGTFEWFFGDGTSYVGANPPTHTYTGNGSFSVVLIQTNANGCSRAVTQSNIVNISSIEADFEADTLRGCEVLGITFTDLSTSPTQSDPITNWDWDFGNGSTYNGQNPPIQLFNEGVYDVTLTISTQAGCSNTITFDEYISVGIVPTADFTWTPPSGCAKSDFLFTNTSTIPSPHDPNDLEYEWSFGDGETSDVKNPGYNYPLDTGFFQVDLIVKYRGCPDTVSYADAIYIDAPIALFNTPLAFCNPTLPLTIDFNDQAIIGKVTDSAKMIWDWGDGTSETDVSPNIYNNNPGVVSHTFNSLGNYAIKQVVYNYTTGCSDSITKVIQLSTINAQINVPNDSICLNQQVLLSSNGSSSNYPLVNYNFNINGDTTLFGPSHFYEFDTAGSYDIVLTVRNSAGCQDTDSILNFEVLPLPDANISVSDTIGCAPLTVTFSNNTLSQSGVPLSSFDWLFEDGSTQTTTSVGQTVNYTFTNKGSFQTELVVTDEFGCTSPTVIVQTEITKPTALFDIPSTVCNDEVFTGTNNSTDFNTSEWFVNDVSESTTENLSTSLNHVGSATSLSYTDSIMLIVTDNNGCQDTLKREIFVSTPHADFDFVFSGANINEDSNFVCPPVFASLTDLSSAFGNITNWDWDFGDGKSSTLQNPNNTYVFAGTYSGSLVITDEFGCQDSITYIDYLTIGGPSGELSWTVSDVCKQEYTFTPSNLDGVTDIMWDMGNGDTIYSIGAFNYSYSSEGTYIPNAILMNEDDCNVPYILDSITIEVNLLNAYFEIDPMSLNWGEPATITDFSSGGYGGIVNWTWEIEGNKFNNNGAAFDYYFNTSGNVTVTLVVTDAEGCQATYQVVVNVTTSLTIPNILTPNGDGINDVFRLIDNSYQSYKVIILNRWGNLVSKSFIIEGDYLWDGLKENGEECTEGVYFYKIDGIQRDGSERTEHGFVHLVK